MCCTLLFSHLWHVFLVVFFPGLVIYVYTHTFSRRRPISLSIFRYMPSILLISMPTNTHLSLFIPLFIFILFQMLYNAILIYFHIFLFLFWLKKFYVIYGFLIYFHVIPRWMFWNRYSEKEQKKKNSAQWNEGTDTNTRNKKKVALRDRERAINSINPFTTLTKAIEMRISQISTSKHGTSQTNICMLVCVCFINVFISISFL